MSESSWEDCVARLSANGRTDLQSDCSLLPREGADEDPLTPGVDNLVDFMRVIGILGIILYHLEAHGQVVQSTAEVGLPSGLVVGKLVDFSTCDCPRLSIKHVRFENNASFSSQRKQKVLSGNIETASMVSITSTEVLSPSVVQLQKLAWWAGAYVVGLGCD